MALIALTIAGRIEILESRAQMSLKAAVAITAGDAMYINADGKWAKAVATAANTSTGVYIATRTVGVGESLTGIRAGEISGLDLSALDFGAAVYLSDTAGRLGDAAGTCVVLIGIVVPAGGTVLGATPAKTLQIDCPIASTTLPGGLTVAGGFAVTLTGTAITGLTLPTAGTLATLAGAETLTNKTLTSPVINTPTLKAFNAAKAADYPVTAGDTGKTFSTVGAAGTVTFSLPAAVVGLKYRFHVGAAQQLRIDPNGVETISLPSTGVPGAAGKYLVADAIGETVDIECCVAGTWSVFGYTGTWTAEP